MATKKQTEAQKKAARSRAAKKAAATRKRNAAKVAKQPTAPTKRVTLSIPGYDDGQQVDLYPAPVVDVERREGREPTPEPLESVKANGDGVAEFTTSKKGAYCVVSQAASGRYLYLTVSVK